MASQNLESNQSLPSIDDGTGATPESFTGLIYWNPMLTPWLTACVWPVLRGYYHRSIILELVTSSMQIELICKIQCKLKMDGREQYQFTANITNTSTACFRKDTAEIQMKMFFPSTIWTGVHRSGSRSKFKDTNWNLAKPKHAPTDFLVSTQSS